MKTIKLNENTLRKIVKTVLQEDYAHLRRAINSIDGELEEVLPEDYRLLEEMAKSGELERTLVSIQIQFDKYDEIKKWDSNTNFLDDCLHHTINTYLPFIKMRFGYGEYLKQVGKIVDYFKGDDEDDD